MPCSFIRLPGGGSAIICGPKRVNFCFYCPEPSTIQCDYPVPPTGRACDRSTCRQHARALSPTLDYCQDHAPLYAGPVQARMEL